MQEMNRRYFVPATDNLSSVALLHRLNTEGTDSMPNEPVQPRTPLTVSPTYEPTGRFDPQMMKHSSSSILSPKSNENDRLNSQKSLSTPKHDTCRDVSVYSQSLPKRKTMSTIQDVKLYKHTSLGQLSNGSYTSTDVKTDPPRRKEMVSCLSEYWAYRIPDYFKAFKDRSLPDWDPNEEYQALLDFTYPLRPLDFASNDLSNGEDLSSDSCFKDSGILNDGSLLSPGNTPTSKSTLSLPTHQNSSSNTAHADWAHSSLAESVPAPRRSSSPLHVHSPSSNLASSPIFKARLAPKPFVEHSRFSKAQLSDSLINSTIVSDCTLVNSITDSGFISKNSNEEFANHLISGDDISFISTTQIPPLNKEWESDEEYLTLPYKINELEDLAQQLEGLSAHLDESAGVTSANVVTHDVDIQDIHSDPDNNTHLPLLYCQQESEPVNIHHCPESEDTVVELRKATDFVRKLRGWSGSQLTTRHLPRITEEKQNSDCLLIHIQNFCSKMEELLKWLYQVAETTENWIPPQPEMESIKSSLDVCMAFKNDVNEHQELTQSVLKSGDILLKSVIDITPVLKETLELIARQSKQFNEHAAHLYSSVLTAINIVKDDLETKQHEQQNVMIASRFVQHDDA
ncbi:centrosomal protein of 68 kDa [Narcine bancroftii]|uniref:centrosomal protein of 68 kDa n=1 Tax=Narcine bancroftii TaxID=1343680 RepID=UPI0038310DC2